MIIGGALILAIGVSAASSRGPQGAGARQQAAAAYAQSHDTSAGSYVSAGGDADLMDEQAQFGYERSAPAQDVSGAAMVAAAQQAATMPTTGGAWQEVTTKPYNAQPDNYTDPFWGNEGAGFSLVGGRTTALAETSDGNWFAGTADGGVWRSGDQGTN
jgi:hypothetical protein